MKYIIKNQNGGETAWTQNREMAFSFVRLLQQQKEEIQVTLEHDDGEESHLFISSGDEIIIADDYGASINVRFYTHKTTDERRVQILMDNKDNDVQAFLEDHDEGLDIPANLFQVFIKSVWGFL